jgi:hypothetical protein
MRKARCDFIEEASDQLVIRPAGEPWRNAKPHSLDAARPVRPPSLEILLRANPRENKAVVPECGSIYSRFIGDQVGFLKNGGLPLRYFLSAFWPNVR